MINKHNVPEISSFFVSKTKWNMNVTLFKFYIIINPHSVVHVKVYELLRWKFILRIILKLIIYINTYHSR